MADILKFAREAAEFKDFHERDISIVLTGAEWFAMLIRITYGDQAQGRMSPEGKHHYKMGMTKLQDQILSVSRQVVRERDALEPNGPA